MVSGFSFFLSTSACHKIERLATWFKTLHQYPVLNYINFMDSLAELKIWPVIKKVCLTLDKQYDECFQTSTCAVSVQETMLHHVPARSVSDKIEPKTEVQQQHQCAADHRVLLEPSILSQTRTFLPFIQWAMVWKRGHGAGMQTSQNV